MAQGGGEAKGSGLSTMPWGGEAGCAQPIGRCGVRLQNHTLAFPCCPNATQTHRHTQRHTLPKRTRTHTHAHTLPPNPSRAWAPSAPAAPPSCTGWTCWRRASRTSRTTSRASSCSAGEGGAEGGQEVEGEGAEEGQRPGGEGEGERSRSRSRGAVKGWYT